MAFIKGIFYSANARAKAWRLLKDVSLDDRKRLFAEVAKTALKTPFQGHTLLEPCRELVRIAREGLEDQEKAYLIPIEILLDSKHSPADRILEWVGKNETRDQRLRTVIHFCAI